MHTSDDLSKTQASTYKNVDQMREINKKRLLRKDGMILKAWGE